MVRHICARCGTRLKSPLSLAGQEDTCPVCGRKCVVPQPNIALRLIIALWALTIVVGGGIVLAIVFWPGGGASAKPWPNYPPGSPPAGAIHRKLCYAIDSRFATLRQSGQIVVELPPGRTEFPTKLVGPDKRATAGEGVTIVVKRKLTFDDHSLEPGTRLRKRSGWWVKVQ